MKKFRATAAFQTTSSRHHNTLRRNPSQQAHVSGKYPSRSTRLGGSEERSDHLKLTIQGPPGEEEFTKP